MIGVLLQYSKANLTCQIEVFQVFFMFRWENETGIIYKEHIKFLYKMVISASHHMPHKNLIMLSALEHFLITWSIYVVKDKVMLILLGVFLLKCRKTILMGDRFKSKLKRFFFMTLMIFSSALDWTNFNIDIHYNIDRF